MRLRDRSGPGIPYFSFDTKSNTFSGNWIISQM